MAQPIPNLPLSLSESTAREFYDRWIGRDGISSLLGRLIFRLSGSVYARTFVREAQLAASDRVLELGCGLGTNLTACQRLVQSRETYVGLDLSHEMIRRARLKSRRTALHGRTEFLLGSAVNLPLQDGSFDVVLLSHMIKYLTDAQFSRVLSEARRVLKDGGKIVLWEFTLFISLRVSNFIVRQVGGQKLRSAEEIRESLGNAGFQDLRLFHIVTPWVPWRNVAFRGRANGNLIPSNESEMDGL
jgi:ubiquinone/menaquinone biosynthesis C-methylase UbiE